MAVEVENKTALTVLSKPVSRTTFVLGKYLGLAGAVSLAMLLVGLAFLFTVRHKVMQNATQPYDQPVWVFGAVGTMVSLLLAALANYFYRVHFPTAAIAVGTPLLTVGFLLTGFWDAQWNLNEPYGKGLEPALLAAMILIWQAVLLLAAVALLASTRLKQAATLAFTFAALVAGLWNDCFSACAADWRPASSPPRRSRRRRPGACPPAPWRLPPVVYHYPAWLKGVYAVGYRVLPNFNFYWNQARRILQNVPVPFSYVGQAGVYTAIYIAALLALAVACFQTKEIS